MLRNASATSFSTGKLGLESNAMRSETIKSHLMGSIDHLLKFLQVEGDSIDDGISISLWLRSLQNDNRRTPILTVSRGEGNATLNGITECDRRQVDLQLTLQNHVLTLLYRTSDPFFEPCQKVYLGRLPPDELAHVAIALTDQHQQLYINGQPSPVRKEPFDSRLTHWSSSGNLHFFSFYDQPSWNGRLYRFELFDQVGDQEHVAAMMSRGLLPTIPHVSHTTFRINEDAEILPESHSAEWYQTPNHPWAQQGLQDNVIPNIHFPITFLDDDLELVLQSRGISHPEAPNVFVYITKLPEAGRVYQLDGSTIDVQNDVVWLSQRDIVFIPDHNTFSALPGSTYATIECCVALQEIFARSQCLSIATIHVIVDPVNDPPLTIVATDQPYRVREGIHEELIPLLLRGWDVDYGDAITAVEIVSPPRLGYLFLSVPVRRPDGRHHGVLLSEMNHLIHGSEAMVEYRFNSTDTLVRDSVVMDSFDFRVRDTHGSWSIPSTVTIQVLSSLTGDYCLDPMVIYEASSTSIPIGGGDNSGLSRSVGIFLEYVPQEDAFLIGKNFEALTGGTILGSDLIFPPYVNRTYVGFESTDNFCQSKKFVETSFGYRVLAFEKDGRISSVSPLVERNITVVCQVQPIGLAISQGQFTTRAFNSFMDDGCSGYNYSYNESDVVDTACNAIVVIDGITVTSDPTHTDRALVTIRCTHGRLTLNPQHRANLRWLDDQAVMRSTITFLSLPSELNDILAHLHFQSQVVGRDEIQISIQYGDCVSDDTFQCFFIQKSIVMDVLPEIHINVEILFDSYPWIPLPFTFTLLLLMKFKGKFRILLSIHNSDGLRCDDTTVDTTVHVRWKQFYDPKTGFFYYMDLEDGCVTWDPPLDEDYIPWDGITTTASN